MYALTHAVMEVPTNSITSTMVSRIQTLGWHVDAFGHLHDLFGPFSLFTVSMTELQYRVEFQWKSLVAQEVAHRACFDGLETSDPDATREWMQQLDLQEQALFRCVLNGAHITQDGKKYCQQSASDICPFCQCSDSRYHRFWECEAFDHLRTHVSAADRRMIVDLPQALTCAGWALQPTTMLEWNEYCANLRLPSATPVSLQAPSLHLFTDGSCFKQHDAKQRFAAFSVS